MSRPKNRGTEKGRQRGEIADLATTQGGVISLDQLRALGLSKSLAAEVRCRRCRYPEPEEVAVIDGVAVTTVARTLVDLAGMVGHPTLRKTVGRAAILRKLDLQAADLALHNAKRRRGLRSLERALLPYRTEDGKLRTFAATSRRSSCPSCSTAISPPCLQRSPSH